MDDGMLFNVHKSLENDINLKSTYQESLVHGKYTYFHYCCDGVDDRGWGCGYRTLQSICSWAHYSRQIMAKSCNTPVPKILDIQTALITMQDKPDTFKNSRDWIGSFEVCLCLDYFYDIPCKILHVRPGKLFQEISKIYEHFKKFGSPVMMGGDNDASSKGIFGIRMGASANDSYLLIIDPHFAGNNLNVDELIKEGWVKWQKVSDFNAISFYNLCMPQHKALLLTLNIE